MIQVLTILFDTVQLHILTNYHVIILIIILKRMAIWLRNNR